MTGRWTMLTCQNHPLLQKLYEISDIPSGVLVSLSFLSQAPLSAPFLSSLLGLMLLLQFMELGAGWLVPYFSLPCILGTVVH